MWKPMHQRPSIFMRHKRKQPSRYVQEVPSIFLPMPLTEELHRQNKTFGDIEIGHTSMQGWRGHMEDQYIIDEFEGIKDHLIVAIFDGHSGTFAAEYCSVNLKSKIEETEAWQEYIKLDVRARKENVAKISEALLKGYLQLDESLLALKKDGLMPDDSGCTAVCCVITPTHVVCANVGDSRAVVGSKNQSIALTDDHKPENPEECARIERAGGFVADNRVVGELAMSRAIGDFRYKLNPNLAFHEQLVIPVPDISVHERNRKNDYVLVVACDGVWDAMSNDEAAVFTQQFLEKPQSFSIHDYMDQPMGKKRRLNSSEDDSNDNSSNNNSEDDDEESGSGEDNEALKPTSLNAASALIAVALAKGSMDNISAIVVKFPAARQLEASEDN